MLKLLPVVTCCCLHLNILAWLVLCSEHSFMEAASRRISKSIESNQQVRNKCLRTSVLTFWLHLFQHGWIVCLKFECGMFATCSIVLLMLETSKTLLPIFLVLGMIVLWAGGPATGHY